MQAQPGENDMVITSWDYYKSLCLACVAEWRFSDLEKLDCQTEYHESTVLRNDPILLYILLEVPG